MIEDRILPWTQDQEAQGYPVWTDWEALQRTVFFLNTIGEVDTSFNITPYDPNSPEDFAYIKNLILELRAPLQYNLITVPHDYPTIQEGIDAVENGDTVLVSSGTYVENINFNGMNIAVIGEDRETTIIDGNQNGSVVTFESGEDTIAVLSGFTIMNGYATFGAGINLYNSNPILRDLIIMDNTVYQDNSCGGGINCYGASPLIENVIIMENSSNSNGGGFCSWTDSNPILSNVVIKYNNAEFGGGVSCNNCFPVFQKVEISNNDATSRGGGLVAWGDCYPVLTNVTVTNNISNHEGGGLYIFTNSESIVKNSILYSNSAPDGNQIFIHGVVDVSYSDIQGGWEGIGNIDINPLFTDPENGDYTLQSNSSCIDAGDPDLDGDGYTWEIDPDDRDPDGTRMDIGTFYHYYDAGDFSISVNYNEGWNMVGLALSSDDAFYQDIFNSIYSGSLYNFDGMYIAEEYLDEGVGYLLRFYGNTEVNFEGIHISEINIPVEVGWNLISGISTLIPVNAVYSSSIIYPGTIYGFEGTYVNIDYIVPGRGYWARAMHDGEITLSSTVLAIKVVEQVDHLSDANTLKLSSGTHSTTLYFGKDLPEGEKLNYSLPPTFPQIAFDARFSDDMKVLLESGAIEVLNPLETLTVEYDIKIDAGEHMTWVLTSESGDQFFLEDTGEFTVPSEGRFTLHRVSQLPKTFTLNQNFPNPFNNKTSIHYFLPVNAHVTIQIISLTGTLIKSLVKKSQIIGYHHVEWNGEDQNNNIVSSGVYIYKLNTSDHSLTGKCIFLK